jgi:hypothetical protein
MGLPSPANGWARLTQHTALDPGGKLAGSSAARHRPYAPRTGNAQATHNAHTVYAHTRPT